MSYMEHEQNLAVDYAWRNKFYDVVLLLLKADSCFPKGLNISELSESDENAKNLKNFVQERNFLHKCIENDDLENVKNIVNKSRSKYYLNDNNVSAICTALKCKKFNIQAYLKSIGAEFFNDCEKEEYEQLKLKDKHALRDANIIHFPYVSNPHIDYLMSKSRTQKPVKGSRDQLKKFYFKLDEIPEVSTIFKVIQYSDYLDIVFDFDEENVARVNPLSTKNTRGEAMYKEGRLYIAASPERGEKKIMGTIAHELTHMAMQILYENECNPYTATDLTQKEILEEIRKELFGNVVRDYPWTILSNIQKEYEEKDYHSELIVTVPQILVECESGAKWLRENASELMNFYSRTIIPKCREFINQSPTLKVKNKIRKFNESLGNLIKLRKLNLCFKNVDWVANFLSAKDKKIFLLRTEHTYLGLVKVLQALFGRNYINEFDKYLALNFEDLVTALKEVMQVFLNGCDKLILQFGQDIHRSQLTKFFDIISEVLEIKPSKNIMIAFIFHPNIEDKLRKILHEYEFSDVSAGKTDSRLSLCYFDEKSKRDISSREITFQGRKIRLKCLIATNEKVAEFVPRDLIEDLIEGKEVYIGSKTNERHNIEEAYNFETLRSLGPPIDEEIDAECFIHELKSSKDIFVIYGLSKKNELLAYFDEYIIQKLIDRATILRYIQNINSDSIEETNKRIVLADRFSVKDIKKFCLHNRDKNIYFIRIENGSLMLKHVSHSEFYVERKLKVFVTDRKKLETLVSFKSKRYSSGNKLEELFIISKKEDDDNLNDLKAYDNVLLLNTKVAKMAFNKFYENETKARSDWFKLKNDNEKIRVHWFHVRNCNEIHWINFYGSVESLREKFTHLNINNEFLVKENDLLEYLTYKKVVLIAGNPGMGKSTSLTKLYESPLIAKTHWAIKINLVEHENEIKTIDTTNFNIEDLIGFLIKVRPYLDNELTENVLKSILTTNSGFAKCLLAFDGFEKIDREHRPKAIFLLKFVQNRTKSQLWITTHLHQKKQLEDELSTFALEFNPLDYEIKEYFIQEFFRDRLKLILKLKLGSEIFDFKVLIYGKIFLYYIETRASKFTETPWQLTLIIINSTKHFITWAKDDNNSLIDFSYGENNALEFYEKFIEKYKMHFPSARSIKDRISKWDRVFVHNSSGFFQLLLFDLFISTEIIRLAIKMIWPLKDYYMLFLVVGLGIAVFFLGMGVGTILITKHYNQRWRRWFKPKLTAGGI